MTMVRSMAARQPRFRGASLYSALQQGVVDGQENPLGSSTILSSTRCRSTRPWTTTSSAPNMILANEKCSRVCRPDLRQILLTGAKMGAVAENGKRMFRARVTMLTRCARGHGRVRCRPRPSRNVPQASRTVMECWRSSRRRTKVDRRSRQGGQGFRGAIAREANPVKCKIMSDRRETGRRPEARRHRDRPEPSLSR